jgi:hypothetical protein
VFPRIVEVEVHLTGVGMGELPPLEIDQHQAPQRPVKQDQIDAIPFGSDPNAFLPRHEGEPVPEFQEKPFEMPHERLFEIRLAVFIVEVEELQQIGIADFVLRGDGIVRQGNLSLGEQRAF